MFPKLWSVLPPMADGTIKAFIFDVDGTLAETEEVHRQAFNEAFAEFGLDWSWTVATYTELLKVTGGKQRIASFMSRAGYRPDLDILAVHARKTEIYLEKIRHGGIALRPGVARLLYHARSAGLGLAVATTTSRCNVDALIASALSEKACELFDALCCGEDVDRKKPDAEVYELALGRLGLTASQCLAFEDSAAGLQAARAAGLRVVITPSHYTRDHDFAEADLIVPSVNELPERAPADWKLCFHSG